MDIAIIGTAVEVPEADDPQALWELVAAGRALAERDFGLPGVVRKHLALYAGLTSFNGGSSTPGT